MQLLASSQQIHVWDCLLLKFVIRNNTSADVHLASRTEYMLGKAFVELRREPNQFWEPHKSIMSKLHEGRSFSPGPQVEKGATHVGLAELFYDQKLQPIFSSPGVYHLRVCIPFKDYGVVKSDAIRIQVVDIPAQERQFIEQNRLAVASAVYGGLVLNGDLDGVDRMEGRLGDTQNKSLIQCHLSILEYFQKRGFRVDDECKQFFARLRKERGDIVADFCTLYCAEHFVNQRQWEFARGLLSTLPEHSCHRDRLLSFIQREADLERWRDKR